MFRGKIDFSISQNALGVILTKKIEWLKNIYNNTEHVMVLDDAPYNHNLVNIKEVECNNLFVAYRDRSHIGYLRNIKFKSNVKSMFFMPFGALIDDCGINNDLEKDIDIIFSGKYYGHIKRSWNALELEKNGKDFLNEVADLLELNPYTIDRAMTIVLKKYGIIPQKKSFYQFYVFLYEYIKTYRRNLLIDHLCNINFPISVCDETWKNSPYSDKLNFVLATTTDEVIEIYNST